MSTATAKSVGSTAWTTRLVLTCIAIALAWLAYMLSIGPVYYLWARCSADMAVHAKIEGFYFPLLHRGPQWLRTNLTDYRDVSRIAGHDATQ